jgi:hypothetical protein
MNLDVVTPVLMIAALRRKVIRAEAEIETHRSLFEKTEALLKLVKDIRDSRTASETSPGWDEWIDDSIEGAGEVIKEIKDAIQRKSERGHRTLLEGISWVLKYKDVMENLKPRLDQCYWSLMVIVIALAPAAGARISEPRQSVAMAGSWSEGSNSPPK